MRGEFAVRLVGVAGDQEEFADLIGTAGTLHLAGVGETGNRYFPAGRGDWVSLSFSRLKVTGDRVTVYTRLGNRFTFRLTPTGAGGV